MTVTLSIIMPVYNAAEYLPECLDSVLRQSFADFELLCIDDGSDDDSLVCLRAYQRRIPRIRVLTQEHGGPARARNLGLQEARGRYVAFLDADDFYLGTDGLRKLCEAAVQHHATVAACRMMDCRYGHVAERDAFREIKIDPLAGGWVAFDDYQDDYNFQAYLFEKRFLDEHHLRFPDYRRYEDPPFLLRVLQAARRVWFLPFALYCYRWGHQTPGVWTQCWRDLLAGIRETYALAAAAGETRLMKRIFHRLDHDFFADLEKASCPELLMALLDLQKQNLATGHLMRLELISAVARQVFADCVAEADALAEDWAKDWLFPYHLFSAGERVVIYGAGDAGKHFYAQIQRMGCHGNRAQYIQLVGIVDQNADRMAVPGMKLYPPQTLANLSYDAVLIAVENGDVAADIRNRLQALGVPPAAIRWDGPAYRRRGFYESFYFPHLAAERRAQAGEEARC